jgi:hypothetical protein
MGILSGLLGASNPAAQWAAQNRGWLGQVGAGLASGPTFEQGLANAAQMGPQGQRVDDAYRVAEAEKAARAAQINQTAQYLAQTFPDLAEAVNAGMPMDAAWNEAMKRSQPGYGQAGGGAAPASVQEYEFARNNGFEGTFADWMQTGRNGAGGPQLGKEPQWAWDEEKQTYVLGQMSTDGRFQPTDMGGLTPVSPFDLSAQRSGGSVFGKNVGGAQFDVPGVRLMATQTQKAIEDIRAEKKGMEEQFGTVLGVIPQQMTPALPGSDKAKFQVAVQRATDRAFLEARELLRGGGQITDFESRKAETAITSMQLAMEKGDKAQFEKALADFEQAVADGVQKLEQQASAMPGYGNARPAAPAAPGGGGADYKTKYGLE